MGAKLKRRQEKDLLSTFTDGGASSGPARARDRWDCPTAGAIWTMVTEPKLLVVRYLSNGPKGFNELMRASGINSKTLSSTLKFLEGKDVVVRRVLSTRPFSVQYSLSASGEELRPVLEALGRWGEKWLPGSRTWGFATTKTMESR